MTPASDELISVPPEELEWALTEKAVFFYLQHWQGRQPSCSVCGERNFAVGVSNVKMPDGSTQPRVLPDGMPPAVYETLPARDRSFKASGAAYTYTCTTCGNQLRFNAGFVATRIALLKRRDATSVE